MNEQEQLIEEQFKKLPSELQSAIKATPWKFLVNEIALLNKLTLEQASLVEQEAKLVIYGFENPVNLVDNLVREVKISTETALNIAEAINERVLKVMEQQADKISNQSSISVEPQALEIPPTNLPMVEEGEVVHEVPHIEVPTPALEIPLEPPKVSEPTPQAIEATVPAPVIEKSEAYKSPTPTQPSTPHYPGGQDPYREPLQ